jgi:hypothetical protein
VQGQFIEDAEKFKKELSDEVGDMNKMHKVHYPTRQSCLNDIDILRHSVKISKYVTNDNLFETMS